MNMVRFNKIDNTTFKSFILLSCPITIDKYFSFSKNYKYKEKFKNNKIFISPPFGNYFSFISYFTSNIIPILGSCTLEQRPGIIKNALKTIRPKFKEDGWVNKMGLRNKGINYTLKNKYKNGNVISLAAINDEDWEKLSKLLKDNNYKGIVELNVSCPNVKKIKDKINSNLNTDKNIEEIMKEKYSPILSFMPYKKKYQIIKLSPLHNEEDIDYFYKIGFRIFHCCNTLPCSQGGLSGRSLKPYVEEKINYLRKEYGENVQIIAGGGVYSYEDAVNYLKLGADHVSISSIMFNPFKTILFFCKYLYYDDFK